MNINRSAIADLHIHTLESDGNKTPQRIVIAAKSTKLKTLALTDHHTTRGFDKVAAIADWYGINLLPGVEISTAEYKSLHILGYGMRDRARMDRLLAQNSYNNEIQLLRIFDNLRELGIDISDEFVDKMIMNKHLSRGKIAKALAEARYARSKKDAYHNLVGPNGSANVDTHKLSAREAIELVTDAGGVACLAHPRSIRHRETGTKLYEAQKEELLSDLVGWGLRGIECLPSARHDDNGKRRFFQAMASNFHLLTVGGSDYHGNKKDCVESLGNPHVKQEHIDALLNEIKISNANAAEKGI